MNKTVKIKHHKISLTTKMNSPQICLFKAPTQANVIEILRGEKGGGVQVAQYNDVELRFTHGSYHSHNS